MNPTQKTEPTIRAVNKKTGQVFEGTIEQARKFGFSDEFIASKLETNKKIAELTNPTQSVGTDTQKFNQKQALNSVLQAEQFYSPGTDKTLALASDATRQSKAKAGGQALVKSFTDSDYQKRLNEFKGQMNLVVGALTQLSGSGAPQADEAKRLLAAAPNETSTDAEAKAWFKSVKSLGGLQESMQPQGQQTESQGATPQGQQPEQPQIPTQDTVLGRASTGNPILDLLKGFVDPALTNIRNYAQDVGAGAGQKATETMTSEGNQNVTDMAQKLYEKAKIVTDPEEKKRLLKLAGQNLDVVSQNSTGAAAQYSDDINQNYLKRGFDVGSSVATLADIGINLGNIAKNPGAATEKTIDALKTGKDKLASVLKLGSKDKSILEAGINLADEGITLRSTAISAAQDAGKTIDGTKIANSIAKWGDDAIAAGEDANKVQKVVLQTIQKFDGKSITPSQAKDFWDAASQGFKDNGRAGNTLISAYQRVLRDGLRSELDTIAPGFEKGTQMIAEGLTKNKILKQVSDAVTKSNLKNELKSPLQKVLGNKAVQLGAGVVGGNKLFSVLKGE